MIQTLRKPGRPIALRLKKEAYWPYKGSANSKSRNIDDTQIFKFSTALYTKLKDFSCLEREQVGILLQKVLGKDIGISSGKIGQWISIARAYFIKEYNQTIIYLPSAGAYKIAQGAEKPSRVSKLGHMSLRWKAKFLTEAAILNDEDMKIAGSSIVDKIRKELGGGSLQHTELLITSAKEDIKTLRIEASNAKK